MWIFVRSEKNKEFDFSLLNVSDHTFKKRQAIELVQQQFQEQQAVQLDKQQHT